MALESATYVSDLNAANPAATDQLSQADDHLRLIKNVLKTTFPNVTGALTATHTVLNGIDARVSVVEAAKVPYSASTSKLTANLDAGTYKVTNLGAPTASTDAARKSEIDSLQTAVDAKTKVQLGSTQLVTQTLYVSSSSPTGGNNGDLWFQF